MHAGRDEVLDFRAHGDTYIDFTEGQNLLVAASPCHVPCLSEMQLRSSALPQLHFFRER